MEKLQKTLAQLPQIDKVIQLKEFKELLDDFPKGLVIKAIRGELNKIREQIKKDPEPYAINFQKAKIIKTLLESVHLHLYPKVQRCVNATGIILHTGLGRAPLSNQAQQALIEVSNGFSTIEYDIETGKRGERSKIVEELLIDLTGAEAATVVNNNAAATLLVLNTLAFEKECIISRGELITIGGSFRIPEIMKKSGAIMVEVGTTNQTEQYDYENAINENTSLLLKVHTSNYRLIGFVTEVALNELVKLGNKHNLPLLHDLGSGSLIDLSRYGLPKEPVVKESITAGADVVTFSGDKLPGGPQAGIIVGKKKYIDLIKKNQLTRPLRCGKLTLAALEATLRLFFDENKLMEQLPVLRLLTEPITNIEKKAFDLKEKLSAVLNNSGKVTVESGLSEVGGGSLATESLPTKLVSLSLNGLTEDELAKKLRLNQPPIITRIHDNKIVFDMRTVMDGEIDFIIKAVKKIII